MEIGKQKIIQRFNKNVRGRKADGSSSNAGHDGKEGYWLERQMGVPHTSKAAPDLFGYEMKNSTRSKTTFGDWSASYYIFKDVAYFEKGRVWSNKNKFVTIFGAPNPEKENRYAWSGKPTPKIGSYNDFGQKLVVDRQKNIIALYSFKNDKRKNKNSIVPSHLRKEKLIIARWDAEKLRKKVEGKFNKLGWFKCLRNKQTGVYDQIVFGGPINFESWIQGVRGKMIYFDNGMHFTEKSRLYSSWRANNKYWESMVIERY